MMQSNRLYAAVPPWMYKSFSSRSTIETAILSAVSGQMMKVRDVDGSKMPCVKEVMKEIGKAFGVPEYFGENSAALYDCLQDLAWLPADGYVLVVTNSECLLVDEPSTEIEWLIELLKRVCETWAHPIALGESWDRGAVPFHVVFQINHTTEIILKSPIAEFPELCCE